MKLMSNYAWGEAEKLNMLISLLTLYGQCMQLRAVLAANLACAYKNSGDEKEVMTAKEWRDSSAFALNELAVYYDSKLPELKQWIESKVSARKVQVGGMPDDHKTEHVPQSYTGGTYGGMSIPRTTVSVLYCCWLCFGR